MNENFMIALEIMGKGMVGIFAVIIVIALIVYLITKFDSKKEESDN